MCKYMLYILKVLDAQIHVFEEKFGHGPIFPPNITFLKRPQQVGLDSTGVHPELQRILGYSTVLSTNLISFMGYWDIISTNWIGANEPIFFLYIKPQISFH